MASKFSITAELNLQTKNLNQVVGDLRKQFQGVDLNIKVKDLDKAGSSIRSVAKSSKDASVAVNGLGADIAAAAKKFSAVTLATGTLIGFTRAVKNAVSDAIEFEREVVKIAQASGQTVTQLKTLRDEVSNVSTTFGVSSKELILAARTLTQAGFAADKAAGALKVLAQTELAATFDSIQDTTEGAIAVLNQFGKEAQRTGSEVQFLENAFSAINQVSKKFAVESSDLITAIRTTGSAFESAGGSLNELIGLFTSVRSTTRESAESIATGFRTIFTRTQRLDTINNLRQLGIELQDAEGKFVGPIEAVKRLSAALNVLDPKDFRFNLVVEELGGFRQVSKVIPLIQQFAVAQKALNVAQGASGSLAKDAQTAQQSLAVQISQTTEKFNTFIRNFSQSSTFQSTVKALLNVADAFLNVADSIQPLIPLIASFASFKIGQSLTKSFLDFGSVVSKKNAGGKIHHFASGGFVPGTGNGDTVPAMLTPGEFVIRKSSVKKLGADNLARVNKYAGGGAVQYYTNGTGGTGVKKNRKSKEPIDIESLPVAGETAFAHLDKLGRFNKNDIQGVAYSNLAIDIPYKWNEDWSRSPNNEGPSPKELAEYIRNNNIFMTLTKAQVRNKQGVAKTISSAGTYKFRSNKQGRIAFNLLSSPLLAKSIKDSFADKVEKIRFPEKNKKGQKQVFDTDGDVIKKRVGDKLIESIAGLDSLSSVNKNILIRSFQDISAARMAGEKERKPLSVNQRSFIGGKWKGQSIALYNSMSQQGNAEEVEKFNKSYIWDQNSQKYNKIPKGQRGQNRFFGGIIQKFEKGGRAEAFRGARAITIPEPQTYTYNKPAGIDLDGLTSDSKNYKVNAGDRLQYNRVNHNIDLDKEKVSSGLYEEYKAETDPANRGKIFEKILLSLGKVQSLSRMQNARLDAISASGNPSEIKSRQEAMNIKELEEKLWGAIVSNADGSLAEMMTRQRMNANKWTEGEDLFNIGTIDVFEDITGGLGREINAKEVRTRQEVQAAQSAKEMSKKATADARAKLQKAATAVIGANNDKYVLPGKVTRPLSGKGEIYADTITAVREHLNIDNTSDLWTAISQMTDAQVEEAFRKSIQRKAVGGFIEKFANGGFSSGTDTVPAMLTPGEFVINKKSAQKIGYSSLNRMNKVGKYAQGGSVKGPTTLNATKSLVDVNNLISQVDLSKLSGRQLEEGKKYLHSLKALRGVIEAQAKLGYTKSQIEKSYNSRLQQLARVGSFSKETLQKFGNIINQGNKVQKEYNDNVNFASEKIKSLAEEGLKLQNRDFSKKPINPANERESNINALASVKKGEFDKLIESSDIVSSKFIALGGGIGTLISQLAGLDSEVSAAVSTFSASLTVYKTVGDAFVNMGADMLAEKLSRKSAELEMKQHELAISENKMAIKNWSNSIKQSGKKVDLKTKSALKSSGYLDLDIEEEMSPDGKKTKRKGGRAAAGRMAGAAVGVATKTGEFAMKAFSVGLSAAKGAVLGFSVTMAAANAATAYFEKKAKKSADILDKEISKLKDNFASTSEAMIQSKTQLAFSEADYSSSLKQGTYSSMGSVGMGAGAGALIGGLVGSLAGPIGTAVGAGIGGTIGGALAGLSSIISNTGEIYKSNQKVISDMSASYAKSVYNSQNALQEFNRSIQFIASKSKEEVVGSFNKMAMTAKTTSDAYYKMQKDLIQTYGSIEKAPSVFQSALNTMSGQIQAVNQALQQYENELIKRAGIEIGNAASIGGDIQAIIKKALEATAEGRNRQSESVKESYAASIETEMRNRAARKIYSNTTMVGSEANISKLTRDDIDESKLTPQQKKIRAELKAEKSQLQSKINPIVDVTKELGTKNAEKAFQEMALQALKNEKAILIERQAREKILGTLNKELALRISLENLNQSLSSINKTVENVDAAFNGTITGLKSSIPDEGIFDLLKPTGENLDKFNLALEKIRGIDKFGGPNIGGQLADNISVSKQAALRLESIFTEIGDIAKEDIPEILKRTVGEANISGPVGQALEKMLDFAIKPTEGEIAAGRGINSQQGRQELIDKFKKFSSDLSEKGKGIIKALSDIENQQRAIYSKIAESQQKQVELREQDVDSYGRYMSAVAKARGRELSLAEKNSLRLAKQAQSVGPLAGDVEAIGQSFLSASSTLNQFQGSMKPEQQARYAQMVGNSERALKQLADQSERTSDTLQEIEMIKGQRQAVTGAVESYAFGTKDTKREMQRSYGEVGKLVASGGNIDVVKDELKGSVKGILDQFENLPIFNGQTGKQLKAQITANEARKMGAGEDVAQMIEQGTSSQEEQLIGELRNIYEQERRAKELLSQKEELMQQALIAALQRNAEASAGLAESLASEFQTLESQKQGFKGKRTAEGVDAEIGATQKILDSLNKTTGELDKKLQSLTEALSKDMMTKPLSDIEVAMTYVKSALQSFGEMLGKLIDKISGYLPFAKGGMVYRAGGGSIFKPKGTDTVPAMLTPGEFVIKKSSVDKIGKDTLSAINNGGDIGMGASAPGGPGYFNIKDKGLLGNGGFGSYNANAGVGLAGPMMGRPLFSFAAGYTDPSQIYAATLGRQADNIRQGSLNAQSRMQSNIANYFMSGQAFDSFNASKAFRQQRKEQGMAIHAAARAHGEKMASSSSYSTDEKDKIYEMARKQYLKPYRNKFRGTRSYAIGGLVDYLARGGRGKSKFYYGSSRAGKIAKYQARAQKRRDAANKSFNVVRQGGQSQARQNATQSVNSILGYNQMYNTERVVPNPYGINVTRNPSPIRFVSPLSENLNTVSGFGLQFGQPAQASYGNTPWNNPKRLKALSDSNLGNTSARLARQEYESNLAAGKYATASGGMSWLIGRAMSRNRQDYHPHYIRRQSDLDAVYEKYGVAPQYRGYASGGSVGGMDNVNSQIKETINNDLNLNQFMGSARSSYGMGGVNPFAMSAISQAYGFATQAYNNNFAGTYGNLYNASRNASQMMHSNFYNNVANGTAQNLWNASKAFRASRGQGGGGSSYGGGRSKGFTRGNRNYSSIGEYAASGNTISFANGKRQQGGVANPYYMRPGSDRPRVGFADGGFVGTKFYSSGGSASDTLPAMLTPGEFVMSKEAVDKHGTGFMKQLNNGGAVQGFAKGGSVGPTSYLAGGGQAAGAGGFDFSAIGNLVGSAVRNSLSGIGKIVNFDALNNLASTFSSLVGRLGSVAGAMGGMNMTHTVKIDGQVNIGGLNASYIAEAIKNEVSNMVTMEVQRQITQQMNSAKNINPMG